mmetsp:Transcript_53411/g.92854  ORF Transcript_53411/g.92854 Transcript_53411/m.92854 type:complete len:111 (-) Transcript_53411:15-347(-)
MRCLPPTSDREAAKKGMPPKDRAPNPDGLNAAGSMCASRINASASKPSDVRVGVIRSCACQPFCGLWLTTNRLLIKCSAAGIPELRQDRQARKRITSTKHLIATNMKERC